MRLYDRWLELQFGVTQTPGVARALTHFENNGDQTIITDAGGFDLPNRNGPFLVYRVARDGRTLDEPTLIESRHILARWLYNRIRIHIPTDPRL